MVVEVFDLSHATWIIVLCLAYEYEAVQKVTNPCPLLAELNEESLQQVLQRNPELHVRSGELLMSAGDPCDQACIVLEGSLALMFNRGWGDERRLEEVRPGGIVGDTEILNGDHCLADVRACSDSRVLALSRKEFERLLQEHPEAWKSVTRTARARICRLLVARQINDLFGIGGMVFSDPSIRDRAEREWLGFEQDILVQLEKAADWVTLERGKYLFRRGDPPDGAYVLVSGLLRVSVTDPKGKEKAIADIRQGEILGEMALITNDVRSASISALRDCELFRLPAHVFAQVTEKYPRSVLNVYRTVTNRFRHSISGSLFREQTTNIAMLSASPTLELAEFALEFTAALSAYASVDLLDSPTVDRELGRTGIAQSRGNELANLRLVEWLNSRELHFGHLVYLGDPGHSAWNERCLRQADRVVIVADATDPELPDLAPVRSGSAATGLGWTLVLLHPEGTQRPVDTARWLDGTGAATVLHVRRGHAADMARLARILSGRAIGLVLGGGGARGFAHLGVLRVLEELGVPIDMVGGTSIGAPICGWVAQGKNAADCLQAASKAFHSLIDYTLPTTALLTGKRISRMINQETASWAIEDFWLPFFCVSTNLSLSRVEVHRRGNSARAIRSSVSIPGVLPPVPERGELLVDGGVLNNLPVDVMRELNPSGVVIAIDVVLPKSFFAMEDYGLNVSGWRQLFARLIPGMKGRQTPGFASIILQSMMVGSSHSRERMLEQDHADFYQNIHVHNVGMLQFESLDAAAAIGYSESIGPLREWVASRPELFGRAPSAPAAESRQTRR
jgi:predicted acylesterase/phospholipase RssA/CRP-like cAMP-binding protein